MGIVPRSIVSGLCWAVAAGLVLAPVPATAAQEDSQEQQPAGKSEAKPDQAAETRKEEETKPQAEKTEPAEKPATDPSFNTLEDLYGPTDAVALLDPDTPQTSKVQWRVVN